MPGSLLGGVVGNSETVVTREKLLYRLGREAAYCFQIGPAVLWLLGVRVPMNESPGLARIVRQVAEYLNVSGRTVYRIGKGPSYEKLLVDIAKQLPTMPSLAKHEGRIAPPGVP